MFFSTNVKKLGTLLALSTMAISPAAEAEILIYYSGVNYEGNEKNFTNNFHVIRVDQVYSDGNFVRLGSYNEGAPFKVWINAKSKQRKKLRKETFSDKAVVYRINSKALDLSKPAAIDFDELVPVESFSDDDDLAWVLVSLNSFHILVNASGSDEYTSEKIEKLNGQARILMNRYTIETTVDQVSR